MKGVFEKIKQLKKRINATCRSKTGSTLLMVVMTMSVMIIIGSSMLMMSFNTNIQSIFASSQVKAEQAALSVVNGIKQAPATLTKMVEQYGTSLHNPNDYVTFTVNSNKLPGTNTITLTVVEAVQQSPTKISVTVNSQVGKGVENIKFTAVLKNNSAYDIINAVTNASAANGGSTSLSYPTKGVTGDVSLYGDYLLALFKPNEDADGVGGSGMIEGNVYCNGSLVLGAKAEDLSVIATDVTDNLYVNGDLILNCTTVTGNVYVAGNILVNGVNSTGGEPIIKGDIYCGGNLYALATPFDRYLTYAPNTVKDKNKESINNSNFVLKYSYNNGGAFPSFPTADEIAANNSKFEGLYNLGLTSKLAISTSGDTDFKKAINKTATSTRNDGTSVTINGYIQDVSSINFMPKYDGGGSALHNNYTVGSAKINFVLFKNKSWDAALDINQIQHTVYYACGYNWGYKNNLVEKLVTPLESTVLGYNPSGTYMTYGSKAKTYAEFANYLSQYVADFQGNTYVQCNAQIDACDRISTYYSKKLYVGGNLTYYGAESITDGYMSEKTIGASTLSNSSNYLLVNGNVTSKNLSSYNIFSGTDNDGRQDEFYWVYGVSEGAYAGTGKRYRMTEELDCVNCIVTDANHNQKNSVNSHANKCAYSNLEKAWDNIADNEVRVVRVYNSGKVRANFYTSPTIKKCTPGTDIIKDGTDGATAEFDWTKIGSSGEMFSAALVAQGANLQDSQKKQNQDKVSGIFKEMGVYGVTSTSLSSFAYKSGQIYVSGDSGTTVYASTGNKINDAEGTNFTGVAIAQVKFASTLERALACSFKITSKSDLINNYLVKVGSSAKQSTMNDLRAAWDNDTVEDYDDKVGVYVDEG